MNPSKKEKECIIAQMKKIREDGSKIFCNVSWISGSRVFQLNPMTVFGKYKFSEMNISHDEPTTVCGTMRTLSFTPTHRALCSAKGQIFDVYKMNHLPANPWFVDIPLFLERGTRKSNTHAVSTISIGDLNTLVKNEILEHGFPVNLYGMTEEQIGLTILNHSTYRAIIEKMSIWINNVLKHPSVYKEISDLYEQRAEDVSDDEEMPVAPVRLNLPTPAPLPSGGPEIQKTIKKTTASTTPAAVQSPMKRKLVIFEFKDVFMDDDLEEQVLCLFERVQHPLFFRCLRYAPDIRVIQSKDEIMPIMENKDVYQPYVAFSLVAPECVEFMRLFRSLRFEKRRLSNMYEELALVEHKVLLPQKMVEESDYFGLLKDQFHMQQRINAMSESLKMHPRPTIITIIFAGIIVNNGSTVDPVTSISC